MKIVGSKKNIEQLFNNSQSIKPRKIFQKPHTYFSENDGKIVPIRLSKSQKKEFQKMRQELNIILETTNQVSPKDVQPFFSMLM